jgi:hypothetical protein
MAITIPLNIILHGNQTTIHRHPAKIKCVKAGKRFGKTKWLLYALTQKALEKPNLMIWYLAPTYRHAKSIAWFELNYLIPPSIIRRKIENELLIEFINGSKLQLIGCDNPDSLRGPKLHGAGWDEAAYINPNVRHIIEGQLLGAQGEDSGFCYYISSPNEKGINWFTEFHSDCMNKMKSGDPEYGSWFFTIYDNPTLNPIQIEKLKNSVSDDKWELEYMAKESPLSGLWFPEFTQENIEAKEYSPSFPLVRGLDWGINHPTTCLWMQYDLKTHEVWVFDEFMKSDYVIEESCTVIKNMTGNKPVEWSVIDPSTNKRNSQTGRTDKDEFSRYGVPCVAGDNRFRGYDILKMFLKKKLLKIHPKCKNLIYQLRNLQREDKEGDDMTDPLRYMAVRIHDLTFNGNVFSIDDKKNKYEGQMNLNDPLMFPQKNRESKNWVMDEIEACNAA